MGLAHFYLHIFFLASLGYGRRLLLFRFICHAGAKLSQYPQIIIAMENRDTETLWQNCIDKLTFGPFPV